MYQTAYQHIHKHIVTVLNTFVTLLTSYFYQLLHYATTIIEETVQLIAC